MPDLALHKLPLLPCSLADVGIPRIFHQVWIGGGDDERAQRIHALWKKHLGPTWQCRLWTDETIKGTSVERFVPLVESFSSDYRLKSDLYRLIITAFYGGMYADSDAVPLRPLDYLSGHRNAWIGSGEPNLWTLMNCTFATPPSHPFLSRVVDLALAALDRGVTNPHWVAGPRQFRTAYAIEADVDVLYGFVTTSDPLPKAMVEGKRAMNLDTLRKRWPDCPVLHVVLR